MLLIIAGPHLSQMQWGQELGLSVCMCGEIYWNEDPGRGRPELDGGGRGGSKENETGTGSWKAGGMGLEDRLKME